MRNRPKPTPERIGVNVRIPAHVHRAAKAALAWQRMTWDEAVSEAVEAWVRAHQPTK